MMTAAQYTKGFLIDMQDIERAGPPHSLERLTFMRNKAHWAARETLRALKQTRFVAVHCPNPDMYAEDIETLTARLKKCWRYYHALVERVEEESE